MFGFFKSNKSYKDLNVAEFKTAISEKNTVILDVRSESELSEGSIPGHILVNVSRPDFAKKVEKMDKNKGYYIYCRSGGRSAHACKIMAKMGFENVNNLKGGIISWKKQN
jgi:phage shock protein E